MVYAALYYTILYLLFIQIWDSIFFHDILFLSLYLYPYLLLSTFPSSTVLKSFQTSGGTVLSTNWGEVSDLDNIYSFYGYQSCSAILASSLFLMSNDGILTHMLSDKVISCHCLTGMIWVVNLYRPWTSWHDTTGEQEKLRGREAGPKGGWVEELGRKETKASRR